MFYNREDLWSVASEVGAEPSSASRPTQPMEPNFVLMTLPGETKTEFVEILPFTPANRNNLIGWIAGRSDDAELRHGARLRLPEDAARGRPAADRSAHRSERAAVGAAVAVEPAGIARPARHADRDPDRPRAAVRRADLSAGRAQPDARAAPRRARAAGSAGLRPDVRGRAGERCFGTGRRRSRPLRPPVTAAPAPSAAAPAAAAAAAASPAAADVNALVADAARDLADYQRLTAEGKLGEAGQKLEALKKALDELQPAPADTPSATMRDAECTHARIGESNDNREVHSASCIRARIASCMRSLLLVALFAATLSAQTPTLKVIPPPADVAAPPGRREEDRVRASPPRCCSRGTGRSIREAGRQRHRQLHGLDDRRQDVRQLASRAASPPRFRSTASSPAGPKACS